MKPNQVTKKNEGLVWHRLYGDYAQTVVPLTSNRKQIKTNSTVRISKYKSAFDRDTRQIGQERFSK